MHTEEDHKKVDQRIMGREHILEAYSLIVEACNELGYNTKEDKQNMKDSGERSAKGFLEIVLPFDTIKNNIKEIMSKNFDSTYTGMVVAQNLISFSLCPHHFLPVIYRATIAYIPKGKDKTKVLGISKIARLFSLLSSRPVLQETLCTDIVETLSINQSPKHKFDGLASEGAACSLEGLHLCMAARGIKIHEARIITQKICGAFNNPETRLEFISLVNSNRPLNII